MYTFLNAIIFYFMTTTMAGTLEVSSTAFSQNGSIPSVYTCEGRSIQPPLTIKNIPAGSQSLAIIMDDPDAPGTFVHWVAWNIDPSMKNILENSSPGTQGMNGKNAGGYTGPCQPTGIHHYHFKIYALNRMLDLPTSAGKMALEAAMEGHVISRGEIVGLYKKIR